MYTYPCAVFLDACLFYINIGNALGTGELHGCRVWGKDENSASLHAH